VLAPRSSDPSRVGRSVQQSLLEVLKTRALDKEVECPGATCTYQQGDSVGELLTRLDATLLTAVHGGLSELGIAARGDIQILPAKLNLKTWVNIFDQGFASNAFFLASFPVTALDGKLIHMEAPARLRWEDRELSAGQFLPWINRLDRGQDLDRRVVQLALEMIEKEGRPIGINLSSASVSDPGFLPWLSDHLSSHPRGASLLWMEVPEAMAYRHLKAFKLLCGRAKSHDCKMGIEHVGHQLSDIGQLHDIGLDYLKVDAALIRDIQSNNTNQTLLRTLCTLGHSLGVTMIAEGVQSQEEWSALEGLGFDGATGPAVTRFNS
jgi:EAL domain-containing protein (putative c-di-GMP-specific phosphodiesterase class I)